MVRVPQVSCPTSSRTSDEFPLLVPPFDLVVRRDVKIEIALSLGLRSNSLPRSGRTLPQQPGLRSGLSTVASGLIDQEDSDGALSAPELPSIRRDRG